MQTDKFKRHGGSTEWHIGIWNVKGGLGNKESKTVFHVGKKSRIEDTNIK